MKKKEGTCEGCGGTSPQKAERCDFCGRYDNDTEEEVVVAKGDLEEYYPKYRYKPYGSPMIAIGIPTVTPSHTRARKLDRIRNS